MPLMPHDECLVQGRLTSEARKLGAQQARACLDNISQHEARELTRIALAVAGRFDLHVVEAGTVRIWGSQTGLHGDDQPIAQETFMARLFWAWAGLIAPDTPLMCSPSSPAYHFSLHANIYHGTSMVNVFFNGANPKRENSRTFHVAQLHQNAAAIEKSLHTLVLTGVGGHSCTKLAKVLGDIGL